MGTAALGGVCSTRAKTTKAMPMRTSMTRKNRMRKGRQSLRGMHFGIAAGWLRGVREPGWERLPFRGCELCQRSEDRPRFVVFHASTCGERTTVRYENQGQKPGGTGRQGGGVGEAVGSVMLSALALPGQNHRLLTHGSTLCSSRR